MTKTAFKNKTINVEPKIEQIPDNPHYYYYSKIELIDLDIYDILYNNDVITKNLRQRELSFENNYMYFDLPGHLCSNDWPRNKEVCFLHSDNFFIANFIIEFDTTDSFKTFIESSKKNGGLYNCFNSYQNNKSVEVLLDNYGNEIGQIYNLMPKKKKIIANNSKIQNINNNNNRQIPLNLSVNSNQNNISNNNNLINYNNFVNNSFNNNNFNNHQKPKTDFPISTLPHPITSIKEEFYTPPLIGLKNVGATCYMNATLQCLSQVEKLASYFKYNKRIDLVITKNKDGLTKSFKNLIENLWPSYNSDYKNEKYIGNNGTNKYFKPKKFKEKISEMNPLFKGVQANDAKDLVNFIIMTLHEELNKSKKYQNNFIDDFNIDQSNQTIVFDNFLNSFIKENQSIISDIFYGVTHTITNCLGCGIYKHNFEAFFFLNFPLEEIRKFKLKLLTDQNIMMSNQMNMNMINQNFKNKIIQQNLLKIQSLQNNHVNIFDCFEYNQKIENFTGENAMYCNTCRNQRDSNYATYLYSLLKF